ncbi:hypothetical protein GCM10027168_50300 [Streptomyces capparidis]
MTDEQALIEQTLAAWRRIEAWLERWAPRSHRRLPPPAAEDAVLAVERDLDLVLPADLRAFYRLRDGTGPGVDFEWATWDGPLPIPQDQWDPELEPSGYLLPEGGMAPLEKLAHWVDGPAGYEREADPGQRYLPFVASDPDGFYGLFADCTPGPGYGALGGYGEADAPTPGLWPSFAGYLTEVADALEEGRGVGGDGYVPGLLAGCLRWDDPHSPLEPGWAPVPGRAARAAAGEGAPGAPGPPG